MRTPSGTLYVADTGNYRIRKISTDGIIATVAGNGIDGYSGDGGLAASAQLGSPISVAVDVAGNLFVADVSNHRIRKISTDGIVTTVAGNGVDGYSGDGGLATNAKLAYPISVAVDATGNLFIAADSRIRTVSTNGIITTIAGDISSGYSGDGGPATKAQLSGGGVSLDVASKRLGFYPQCSGPMLLRECGNGRPEHCG